MAELHRTLLLSFPGIPRLRPQSPTERAEEILRVTARAWGLEWTRRVSPAGLLAAS